MESKSVKKPLSKGATVIIYSTVFILIGMIFTDVTTRTHYLPNILITFGMGWVFMVLLSKNSTRKPLVLGPQPGKESDGLQKLADKIAVEFGKIKEEYTIFCFKCQTIHDSNSVCAFELTKVCEHSKVTDCQTNENFCKKCGETLP